jgi:hypothetical protein
VNTQIEREREREREGGGELKAFSRKETRSGAPRVRECQMRGLEMCGPYSLQCGCRLWRYEPRSTHHYCFFLIQKLRNDNNSQLHPTQQDTEGGSNCSEGYVSLLPSVCRNASHPDSCPLASLSVDHARILAGHHVKIQIPISLFTCIFYCGGRSILRIN